MLAPLELAVVARDGIVLEHEIVVGRLADTHSLAEEDLTAALRAAQDDDHHFVGERAVDALGARADLARLRLTHSLALAGTGTTTSLPARVTRSDTLVSSGGSLIAGDWLPSRRPDERPRRSSTVTM